MTRWVILSALVAAVGLGVVIGPTGGDDARGENRAEPGRAKVDPGASESEAAASTEPSLGQQINAFFAPLVQRAAKVMFWDPFAALGLYDPVIRDEAGQPLRDEDGKVRETNFPLVVVWLIFAALFFTLKMRFINFRGFAQAVRLIRGKYADPDAPGEVTHFQALSTALSGTVGLGNIAGVALAIGLGGPGATFWMIAAGLLGMSTKFTECTLGVKYRELDEEGRVSGGPMYYLRAGLARRRLGGWSLAPLGTALGTIWAFFAIFGSLGGGNMFQANQSFAIAVDLAPALEGYGPHFGAGLALLVMLVVLGGIQGIGRVTGLLVPLMAVIYVGTSLLVIFANITRIGDVFALILSGAFEAPAIKGGFIGVMVVGLRRAAFSNEAGVGTAAIAHSAAQTREPIAEGFVGLHEPFVDTVLICTMTALVLIFTGYHDPPAGLTGAALTSAAFGSVFSWFPYVLGVAILLFSFSTLISFAYYGIKCFDFVFGALVERLPGAQRSHAAHFFTLLFAVATVVGSSSSVEAVMAYADMIIFSLAVTNSLGLFIFSGEVARDLRSYQARLASGEIRPTAG